MVRLPRFLPFVVLACVGLVPVIGLSTAQAQSARTPGAASELQKNVDDFWHYAKIARYDLAAPEGQKVLARSSQPVDVLQAFEAVAEDHKDNLDQWMLRWQGVDEMRELTTQLIALISKGYKERREDQNFVEQNIQRLPISERAYTLAIGRLRESGELAVKMMIDYLRDSSKKEYHTPIRRALADLGRQSLNPLVAATKMKDPGVLVTVISVLGEIGYDVPVPYLAELASSPATPPTVKVAATEALARIGRGPAKLVPASLFYELGERLYYGTSDISPDSRTSVAYIWSWDEAGGLSKKNVPAAIFGDLMAMQAAERVLKLDPSRADAVSLWLAANYKREVDLPAGANDPMRREGQYQAHYYGVAAGTQYLNPVLARAMNDRNSALALRAIGSLERIVGQSNLFAGPAGEPLVAAMRYPDRLVRFEAAMALAAALPQKPFDGRERVVPVLAEALGQTGKPAVLVVMPDQDDLNVMMDGLKQAGYLTAGGTTADSAVAAAEGLPAVDAILISEEMKPTEIDRLFVVTGQSPRLQGVAKLVMTKTQASPYAAQALSNPLLNVTQATAAASLRDPLEAARVRAGTLPLDEKDATTYALRAAQLLEMLASTHNSVLEPAFAEPALLAALDDERPELVKAAGNVLALLKSRPAQMALLRKALDEKASRTVKLSLYQNLTNSARFYGNLLDDSEIAKLQDAVEQESDQVRPAAAEARGALNLPADQAKRLILGLSDAPNAKAADAKKAK